MPARFQPLLVSIQKRIMRVPPNVAGIAQLVEQGFCKPQVRGSIPCAGTKLKPGPNSKGPDFI